VLTLVSTTISRMIQRNLLLPVPRCRMGMNRLPTTDRRTKMKSRATPCSPRSPPSLRSPPRLPAPTDEHDSQEIRHHPRTGSRPTSRCRWPSMPTEFDGARYVVSATIFFIVGLIGGGRIESLPGLQDIGNNA